MGKRKNIEQSSEKEPSKKLKSESNEQTPQQKLKLHIKPPDILTTTAKELEAELNKTTEKFINKQRTLIFACRGIGATHRHLMKDLRSLMPHSKEGQKYDERNELTEINTLCKMYDCRNCIYFENHRNDLYMYVLKSPKGPTLKFKVTHIATMKELKLTGNCLKGSRPILHFDSNFESSPHYQLIKEMFTQVFATPKGHPNSKPFVDHIFSFYILDDKIWFRNYQIVYKLKAKHVTEKQLVEIGPRFVLDPIRILDGSFSGELLFNNQNYKSTRMTKRELREKYAKLRNKKYTQKKQRQAFLRKKVKDPVESVFLDSDDEEETAEQMAEEEVDMNDMEEDLDQEENEGDQSEEEVDQEETEQNEGEQPEENEQNTK